MKKLIAARDVRKSIESGEKYIIIDSNTIITPAARDYANEMNIKFVDQPIEKTKCETKNPEEKVDVKAEVKTVPQNEKEKNTSVDKASQQFNGISRELIAKIVREVIAEKKLQKAADSFYKECDTSGLRLVHGDTVTCERFDNGNPSSNVGLKDIVSTRESPNMGAGFMTIDKSSFNWELCYDEFDYIVDGNLDITINGRKYKGKAGDVFFIPKNSKITWSTQNSARFFYVTYPANWADLAASK